MLNVALLVLAVCTDCFAMAVTYGLGKIKIPVPSAVVVSGVGAVMLAVSLVASGVISRVVPSEIICEISAIALFAVGAFSLFNNYVRGWLLRCRRVGKGFFTIDCLRLAFVIDVYLDETKADSDNSKTLSVREAMALAVALSVDSLAIGVGGGLTLATLMKLEAIVGAFVAGVVAIKIGQRVGGRIARKNRLDLSFLSGVALIVLAVGKLVRG